MKHLATCRYDRHEPGLLRPGEPLGGHGVRRGQGGALKHSLQHSDGENGQRVVPANLGHDGDQHAEHSAAESADPEHPLAAEPLGEVSPEELREDVADGESGQEETLLFRRPREPVAAVVVCSLKLCIWLVARRQAGPVVENCAKE